MHKVDGFNHIDIVYVITTALNPMKIQFIPPRSASACLGFFLICKGEMWYTEMVPKGIVSIMASEIWK